MFPVQYSTSLPIISFVESCVYTSVSISQSPFPLLYHQVTISFISTPVILFLFCRSVHLCRSLDTIYRQYHMMFVLSVSSCCAVTQWCPTFCDCIDYRTGEENGNTLHYSCLENPMDRGAWWGRKESGTTVMTWFGVAGTAEHEAL